MKAELLHILELFKQPQVLVVLAGLVVFLLAVAVFA